MISRFVIVTGISGAGKTSSIKILEDIGFYCVDNLPVSLVSTFMRLILNSGDEQLSRVALGVDIRSGKNFDELPEIIDAMRSEDVPVDILFLEASEEVVLKRYKETRRYHPLTGRNGSITEGVAIERERLAGMRKHADYLLDTSHLLIRDLTKILRDIFTEGEEFNNMIITIMSFGFKFGIPEEADLVFDVRFLPNPYYVENLKKLSGNDTMVSDYVMNFDVSKTFLTQLHKMIRFLVPHYADEGKTRLMIAIGCTGGRHRSVTFANELYRLLQKDYDNGVHVEHRDLEKDIVIKGL